MCEPVTAGLLISAISGGISAKNNADAFKRKDKQTAAGIRRNSANQRDADTLVNQQIEDLGANTGEAERAASLGDFQNALRAGEGATAGSLPAVAGANERFVQRTGAAEADVRTAGDLQAQNLSVIDGILRQRINEGQDIARTGQNINEIKSRTTAEDFLTRLRVNAERPNEFVNAAAGIGQGVGAGMILSVPKLGTSAPSIIGEAGVDIGGAGAVNPFTSTNPFANVKFPSLQVPG